MIINSKPIAASDKVRFSFSTIDSLAKLHQYWFSFPVIQKLEIKILFFFFLSFLSRCVQSNYWCYQIQGDLPLLPLKGSQNYSSSYFFILSQSKAFLELFLVLQNVQRLVKNFFSSDKAECILKIAVVIYTLLNCVIEFGGCENLGD